MAFPSTLDDLTNPTAADYLDTPGVIHATLHANEVDAIEALEAKVGVDSSAIATSLDYKLTNASSSNPGHKHTIAAVTDISPFAATILDDANAAAVRTTIGAGTGNGTITAVTASGVMTSSGGTTPDITLTDAELLALAGLTSAADKLPYFTGVGTATTADLSAFARTILDDANAAAVRTTIGAGTGNGTVTAVTGSGAISSSGGTTPDISLTDAELLAIAGLTSAADKGIQFTGSGTAATYDLTTAGKALLDDADATAQRATLGLVIGTNVQAYDAELAAIAGLTSAADKGIQFTGAGTAATYDLTTAGKALLDDADASAQRTTLGLVIGTNVQAQDAELQAIAGLTSAADKLPYFTGSGTATVADFTAAGRALVDDADATAQRATLGLVIGTNVQAQDAELQAIAGLTSAADRLPYFTGSGTADLATFTAAGRALVDDADATAQRVTLGLVIGTNVQAQDAELSAIAGLTSAADRLPYFTGSGTAALATYTALARTIDALATLTANGVLLGNGASAPTATAAGTANQYLAVPAAGGAPAFRNFIPSGTTLPASPKDYDLFVLAPTGRKYLMQYNGSAWVPLIANGATTLYVSKTGTDSQANGFGTGTDAYLTIQYALDQLPGLYSGHVTTNVGAGTYAENVVLIGKTPTGNYSISITGVLTTVDTLTTGVGSVQGGGAVQGTVVRSSGTWTASARANMLVRYTSGANAGYTKVVDDNTTTTLTMVHVWPGGAPANGDTFVVEDWSSGVIIAPASGSAVLNYNGPVGKLNLTNIKFDPPSGGDAVGMDNASVTTCTNCHLKNGGIQTGSSNLILTSCYAPYGLGNTFGERIFGVLRNATVQILASKVDATNGTLVYSVTSGVHSSTGTIYLVSGSVVKGVKDQAGGDSNGVVITANGYCLLSDYVDYPRITGWDVGAYATTGGQAELTAAVTYSGNDTNTTAVAASYGSIT